TLGRVLERFAGGPSTDTDTDTGTDTGTDTEVLAARVGAAVAREAAAFQGDAALVAPLIAGPGDGTVTAPMGLSIQPPRSGRELMAEHVTAVVCCAAVDTAGAAPGLDWLDGPTLLVDGERAADLTGPVLDLVERGDARALRDWLTAVGIRPDKPVRLV
ncbi:MAG: hypothetical protein ACRDOV_14385, partial [Streptomyces sp.]